MSSKIKIAVSIGDINGIGLEIFLKAINSIQLTKTNFDLEYNLYCPKVIFDDYFERLSFLSTISNIRCTLLINNIKLNIIDFEFDLNNIETEIKNNNLRFGTVSKISGELAHKSFKLAVDSLFDSQNVNEKSENIKNDILLTLPISKESVHLANWQFPGHTEYLAHINQIVNPEKQFNPLMIISTNSGKVALVTVHIPLKNVSESLSIDKILEKYESFYNSLKFDYGIENPKIAILGLNPHAGENGEIGSEEIDIINKSIQTLKQIPKYSKVLDYDIAFPADGFFAHNQYKYFDGVLAMYHDQGLIPFKMLANGGGVNFTANIDIIRVSPDHGTAFNIAGKGIANPQSTIDAIIEGISIFENRTNLQNK